MKKEVKYISGSTEKSFILNQGYSINIRSFNPYETKWSYDGVVQQFGVDITRFTKQPLQFEIVMRYRGAAKSIIENMEAFFAACEADVMLKTAGRLWVGDQYIDGFFIERTSVSASDFYGREQTLVFLAPYPFWITEITKQFWPVTGDDVPSGVDYPYDYQYDYSPSAVGRVAWSTGHFAPSRFQMVVYGAVTNPEIDINENRYTFFDVVEAGEYVVIDSRKNSIIKHRTNNTTLNLFDMRGKVQSIFKAIPGGIADVSWNGAFGFSITLFAERSEPLW